MRTLAIIVVGLLAMSSGCAQQEQQRVDERFLASLGLAQAYQLQAEELERLGDRPGAVEKVRQILSIEFPAQAPEAEDIRLDAYGRIAELLIAQDQTAEAQAALDGGLRLASRESYFKARLFSVQGRVHQHRARQLEEAGDQEGARAESRRALEAFERSIQINRAVLGLTDGGDEK